MKYNIQNIPIIFNAEFPKNYVNNVLGWGIPESELHNQLPDGTYRLLSLDLDFGLKCSLQCPHCFQNNQNSHDFNKSLTFRETLNLIDQAKDLGLKYIKILGAGEPFENPDFLDLLIELDKREIHTAIFTKGHILGSDEMTKKYFGHKGINKSSELISLLYKLRTSILLGFNSFDAKMQMDFVGISKNHRFKDYIKIRDRAFCLLAKAGFNNYIPLQGTRMALVSAPFKPENINEIFDIYKFGRVRNIYVATCPTTSSGNGNKELIRESAQDFDIYVNKVKELYENIYIWAINRGVVKRNDFEKNGVSLYPGAHPCNQVAGGLYIRLDGSVYLCPGNDDNEFLVNSNIKSRTLKEIWMSSSNYTLAAQNRFNYECIARKDSFFGNYKTFYKDVYDGVLENLR